MTFLTVASTAYAMIPKHHHEAINIHGMHGTYPMQRDATGISSMPASALMLGIHRNPDNWFLMVYGFLMTIYDDQGGPLGENKFFSENMENCIHSILAMVKTRSMRQYLGAP